jgi:hypothetical protein
MGQRRASTFLLLLKAAGGGNFEAGKCWSMSEDELGSANLSASEFPRFIRR